MGIRKVKQVFGAVVILNAAIFAINATAADVVAVSGVDGQPITFPDKGDDIVEETYGRMAKMMGENNAQIALTINKNLSLDVLGVRAGERVEPCKKGTDNDCHFDQSKVFSQETLTVTVVEGSCCTYISTGSDTYEFCPPQWPLEFINSISGESCPSI